MIEEGLRDSSLGIEGRRGQQADIESHACAYAADWEPYAKPDEPDEAPNSLTNIPKKLYL